jgi:hypothetical protein
MKSEVEKQFEDFKNATGDLQTKLRTAGFIVNNIKTDRIESMDEFLQIISDKESIGKEYLRKELKKVYRNHMNRREISTLLQMGKEPFNSIEIIDANRLLPVNEDGGISVDELISFLYK